MSTHFKLDIIAYRHAVLHQIGLILNVQKPILSKLYLMPKTYNKKYRISPTLIFFALISILSFLAYSLSHQQTLNSPASSRLLYTTNSSRISLVNTYCKSTATISQSDRNTNTMYNNSLSSYLQANSTIVTKALLNLDFNALSNEISANGIGTIVFVFPFALGLALMLLIWPFLLCCCVCQEDCPVKCCRDRNPDYSIVQLNLPTVFVIILALVIVASAIPALTNSNKFFADFNCQISKFIDDFYNGNTTSNLSYFFTGVTTLRTQLTSVLYPALSALQTQINMLQDLGNNTMNTAKTKATAALNSMKSMPNGNNYNSFTLTYKYPLQNTSVTDSLNSVLSTKIGTYADNATYLGNLYSYINTLLSNLTDITTAAGLVSPHLTATDMGAQINVTDTILASIQTNLDTLNSQISSMLSLFTTIDSYNTQYSMAIYGSFLGLSVLILIGVILIKCLNLMSSRYCLYLCCLVAFFASLLAFALAIVLSLIMPSLFYTCSYLSSAFDTPSQFSSTMTTIGGNNFQNLSSYFSPCFGGTNDFLTQINPSLSSDLLELKTAVFNSHLYNFTHITNHINSQLLTIQTAINNYGLGHIPDFDINSSQGISELNFFNQIANKSYFQATCPSSTFSTFYTDIWVPGFSSTYQSLVSCNSLTQEDSSICSSGLVDPPCSTSACLDSFSILSYYYRAGTTASIIPQANNRYGACPSFTNYLTNFLNNYVQPVNINIGNTAQDNADNTRLAGRFVSMTQTPVNTLLTYMNSNVQSLFQNVYGNITVTQNLLSIFDPTSGLITGLDCRLLQQDLINARNSLCILSFNRIYLSLVVVAIMAFALALQVCCLLCFTVRHYQHSLRTMKIFNESIPLEQSTSSIQQSRLQLPKK